MKTIYVKCLNGNYFEVLKPLQSICKKIQLEKETFIIKEPTPNCYAEVKALCDKLNSGSKQVLISWE